MSRISYSQLIDDYIAGLYDESIQEPFDDYYADFDPAICKKALDLMLSEELIAEVQVLPAQYQLTDKGRAICKQGGYSHARKIRQQEEALRSRHIQNSRTRKRTVTLVKILGFISVCMILLLVFLLLKVFFI